MDDFGPLWVIVVIALLFIVGMSFYDTNTTEITNSNFIQLENWLKEFPQLKQTKEFTEAIRDNKISNNEFEGLKDRVKEFKDQQKIKKLLSVVTTQPVMIKTERE